MAPVSIRDLRNHGGEVIERVEHGESVVITRSGNPVAELRPLRPRGIDASILLARWRTVPQVDPQRLFRDLDRTLDASL
ncbi:MAG: type II toxin-antitoxin system prevent-host-death family antitoxin [Actinomycetota bacterium]|nr:type II toxin-antitoxin system prevent-host-death family antitoxin [Actinomycetota bacterium]